MALRADGVGGLQQKLRLVGAIKIGNSAMVCQRGLGTAVDDREARGAIPTGRRMSLEEFVRSLESPGVGVSAGCLGELQASAQLVLKSKFVSHFTSRDRLSRRYARELPIVHLWGAIFLHSSWLNEGSDCLSVQALFGFHGVLSLRMALRMVSSFRAVATMATILGLPACTRRSRNCLRVGLKRAATMAAM